MQVLISYQVDLEFYAELSLQSALLVDDRVPRVETCFLVWAREMRGEVNQNDADAAICLSGALLDYSDLEREVLQDAIVDLFVVETLEPLRVTRLGKGARALDGGLLPVHFDIAVGGKALLVHDRQVASLMDYALDMRRHFPIIK